ncbi:hypothetical protein E0W68_04250 [Flavobacterium salilacus subsp. salilacus]|uniref:hypothetical protein n=1 Tax=Flavobacterium TaxID=237 RepID=UPI0010755B16|nr:MULTISPECIES: hypothetical protein [Flavobacterium]KAF2519562.1 hypothetical protein E0W68_04250 [Flavobacterium salilacus subsp. salilacus]MBE1614537.1 hypothetical protein [Flavobacterium sp. SaA2.13]
MKNTTFNHWESETPDVNDSKAALNYYGDIMPYEDPAIVNPDELATFPKQVTKNNVHHNHHHHHPLHIKTTPVRDGRNITRTDNHPERNGFI